MTEIERQKTCRTDLLQLQLRELVIFMASKKADMNQYMGHKA